MTDRDPVPESRERRSVFMPLGAGRRRAAAVAALLGAFAIGAGATAVMMGSRRVTVLSMVPAPITAMRDWSPVAVRGEVAEVFGNKFVVTDDSGRALVDTGRAGEGATLVARSEAVTVQGRFEHGFIHAAVITHADGRSDVVGPPGPPRRRGLLSWRGLDGLSDWLARHPTRNG
jgi:hypothetical protein